MILTDLQSTVDVASALGLSCGAAGVLALFAIATARTGPKRFERLEREAPLPIVGKAPMEAFYVAITLLVRPLSALHVSANAITMASLALAVVAGGAFAFGHFGLGAAVATAASLLDALDGALARATNTQSRYGQVLDTMVDRWVDALLLGGIAIFVRDDPWLLGLSIAALAGSFMVSYASSVLREIGVREMRPAMRRAERITLIVAGAALVPLAARIAPASEPRIALAPLVFALALIAVRANLTAATRLLSGARADAPKPDSAPHAPRFGRAARERLRHL